MSQVINRVENEISTTQINQSMANTETLNAELHKLFPPYKEKKGGHKLKNIKGHLMSFRA